VDHHELYSDHAKQKMNRSEESKYCIFEMSRNNQKNAHAKAQKVIKGPIYLKERTDKTLDDPKKYLIISSIDRILRTEVMSPDMWSILKLPFDSDDISQIVSGKHYIVLTTGRSCHYLVTSETQYQ